MRLRQNQTKIIGLLSVIFVMLLVTFVIKLPAANTSLEGTSWTLVSWGEQTALIPPLANTKITAEFKSDTVSGSGGCNQ
ncbi:MAG: META domain-containing protein [Moorea sp. SIO2B7]|nr:META domain-containing protein [Moorena sp. SIO2B7]